MAGSYGMETPRQAKIAPDNKQQGQTKAHNGAAVKNYRLQRRAVDIALEKPNRDTDTECYGQHYSPQRLRQFAAHIIAVSATALLRPQVGCIEDRAGHIEPGKAVGKIRC